MFSRLSYAVLLSGAVFAFGGCGGDDDKSDAPPAPEFKTFFTALAVDGDVLTAGSAANAILSADAICNDDTNRPAGDAVFKAMLVDDVNRKACATADCATGGVAEQIDWVFKPNGKYFRSDGTTLIFQANALGLYDLSAAPADFLGTAVGTYWTGLVDHWLSTPTQFCGGSWASGASGDIGGYGGTDWTGWGAIGGAANFCDGVRHLFCVEQ